MNLSSWEFSLNIDKNERKLQPSIFELFPRKVLRYIESKITPKYRPLKIQICYPKRYRHHQELPMWIMYIKRSSAVKSGKHATRNIWNHYLPTRSFQGKHSQFRFRLFIFLQRISKITTI